MSKFTDHESYITAAPEQFRPLLSHMRSQLARALPDADELIMYDMPGFGYGKTIVASYAAFSKQCGAYFGKGAIAAHSDEIAAAGLKATKTGITFSPRNPIPDALLTKLAHASRKEAGF